jgi:hypothetical protein
MPITVRPGMADTRAEIALMLRAMSSARPTTRLALMPGAGSSSYMVTTGPVRTAVISPFTLKSSSTVSSRRALRSRLSLSIFWADLGGAIGKQVERRQFELYRTGLSAGLCRWRAGRQRAGLRRDLTISGGLRGASDASISMESAAARQRPCRARPCRQGAADRALSSLVGRRPCLQRGARRERPGGKDKQGAPSRSRRRGRRWRMPAIKRRSTAAAR